MDHSSEPPSAKGLAVFRDPLDEKRTATSINWHPDPSAPAKIAVSYSDLTFQNAKFATSRMPQQSFIWDILNPNTPDSELLPPSPLCCLRFNPKNTDSLVGESLLCFITVYCFACVVTQHLHLVYHVLSGSFSHDNIFPFFMQVEVTTV